MKKTKKPAKKSALSAWTTVTVEKIVTYNKKKFALEYQFVSRNRSLVFRGLEISVNEVRKYDSYRWHKVAFLYPGYTHIDKVYEGLPEELEKLKSSKDVRIPDDVLVKAQKALKLTASRKMSKT